jgi:hypothetical protein
MPCNFEVNLIIRLCFLPSLAPFGQAVSEEKIFFNISQSETRIALAAIYGKIARFW